MTESQFADDLTIYTVTPTALDLALVGRGFVGLTSYFGLTMWLLACQRLKDWQWDLRPVWMMFPLYQLMVELVEDLLI